MSSKVYARPERQRQTEQLTAWAARQVGPVELVANRSQRHGRALVLEIAGTAGRWFVKRPKDMQSFRRELNAYQEYVPHITAPAPQLVATSIRYQAFMVTALSGRVADEKHIRDRPDVHRMAGAWLAQLHGSVPPVPVAELGAELRQRLLRLLAKSWDELDRPTVDYLTKVGDRFAEMPVLHLVPCHLDFTQRNWVLCDDGQLGVIDFSGCDLGMVAEDLSRLANREWTQNPDLKAAFLAGYGRDLDDLELEQVECCTALAALSALTRGTGSGNKNILAPSIRTLRELQRPAGVVTVPGPLQPQPRPRPSPQPGGQRNSAQRSSAQRQSAQRSSAQRNSARRSAAKPSAPSLLTRVISRFQRAGRDGR